VAMYDGQRTSTKCARVRACRVRVVQTRGTHAAGKFAAALSPTHNGPCIAPAKRARLSHLCALAVAAAAAS
jgi:hypothetical protein